MIALPLVASHSRLDDALLQGEQLGAVEDERVRRIAITVAGDGDRDEEK